MTSERAIETRELRKRFGTKDAVSGLTLTVPRGSICGRLMGIDHTKLTFATSASTTA